MRQITLIDGHPDASRSRLNHALADHYIQSARACGAQVRRIDLATIDFPILRSTSDFYDGHVPDSLREAQRDIAWADHLVFFYPLWHGNMPELLKAFIEQTFRPGFAMGSGSGRRFPKPLFKGKSARVVVTMGMPAFIYRALFGGYGVRSFERSVLALSGVRGISETLLGGAGRGCEARVRRWFSLMTRLANYDTDAAAAQRRHLLTQIARSAILLGSSHAAYVASVSVNDAWLRDDH